MTKEEVFAKIAELPDAIQDFLFSERSGELNTELFDKNTLAPEPRAALLELVNLVIIREVSLDALEPEIEKRLGLDKPAATKLALDAAGYRLLPLDKWLGNVSGYIRTLGGDPSAYPNDRVQLVIRTPEEAAADLVKNVADADIDTHLQLRLKDVAASYFRGVRTEAQALELLMRPEKIGGMEMSEHAAKTVIDEMKEESKATLIGDQPAVPSVSPPSDETEAREPASPEATPAPGARKGPQIDAPTEEDEAEAKRYRDTVLRSEEAMASAATAEKIKASVEQIYAASGISLPDVQMQERLKSVIGNRLRDVRDALETLEILAQPKELGGVGLSQDVARNLLKRIDQSLAAVHETHRGEVEAKKFAWLQGETEKKQASDSAAESREAAQVESLFQSIIAKSPKALRNAPAAALPPVVKAEAPKAEGTAPAPDFVPGNLPIVPEAVPPAPVQAPPLLTLVRPAAQMAAGPATRPLMQDIKPAPGAPSRLTGPAEELGSTTIVDFRRLSKDPVEACIRIGDKIELLHRQSYEKRTEGIVAWMGSEVYRTYLEMMREALEGKPLPQVSAERQAAGQPTLTIEEVHAVADLSRTLRY